MSIAYVLVNFGGPRSEAEIAPFLIELLGDRDVIQTRYPSFLHRLIFTRIAKKRAERIKHDYNLIGGKSPLFEDTERLAAHLREALGAPVITFHRYLPQTHAASLHAIDALECDTIKVFPLFPQFTYATTGSIARFFKRHLEKRTEVKLQWRTSYPDHPSYIAAMAACLRDFLEAEGLQEEETLLFFSAHGLPRSFIEKGDRYERECNASYEALRALFPKAAHLLAYQSKFGPGEWLRPYTNEVCSKIGEWGRSAVVFIPLTFTSDHVETLFEIEYQYLPLVRAQGFSAFRCPALNLRPDWLKALKEMMQEEELVATETLIRR